ncbi:MAG: hypothetical protein GXO79_03055 [Chlorobi bacterium]|nr:hypothetical protein [Chlorobiota bacterium]
MKIKHFISGLTFIVVTLLLCINYNQVYAGTGNPQEVQYIAIHFGNPDMATVIDKTEFPAFNYYVADGNVYSYYERVKMMKNPKFLKGYYGEVPEKMGFGANAVAEKNKLFPYENGCIYVVDPNGVIYYQLDNAGSYVKTNSNYPDAYDKVYNELKSAVKNLRKGKVAKVAKKQEYLKSTPIGELAPFKDKIDKSQEGIKGWNIPDLKIKTAEGTETTLADVCKGKTTVLVFYSLNGIKRKIVQNDGTIKEIEGEKLINTKTYAGNAEEKIMNAATPKDFFKQSAKMATTGTTIGNFINSEEELDDAKKAALYKEKTELLRLVSNLAGNLK